MSVVWDAELHPTSLKLTALALADWSNDEGGSLHPSMAAIAQKVSVSRSQAQRLVHQLMERGLLSVLANAKGGHHKATPRYQLHLAKFAALCPRDRLTVTGSIHAMGTGRMDAMGTGSTDAAPGVAPMHRTGSTHATQTIIDPSYTERRDAHAARAPAPDRGSRLPKDWRPSPAEEAFCREHRPTLNPSEVASRFRDYWVAQPGAKGRKADWAATWRNWVRNERSHSPSGFPLERSSGDLLAIDEQLMPVEGGHL